VNRVQLIGNLGRDPEMRFTASGSAVSTFSVAVSRSYSDEGERKEETEWSRIVAFDRQGELAGQYLHKGSKVYVEGRLTTRSWETPEGQRRYTTEVVASRILFLDSRQGGGAPYPGSGGDIDLDDIPFEG
jgi:single-strand DNA-binding protein